jgi:hypothetical protein
MYAWIRVVDDDEDDDGDHDHDSRLWEFARCGSSSETGNTALPRIHDELDGHDGHDESWNLFVFIVPSWSS